MPTPNPFFALQSRLADLLLANAYFAPLVGKNQILTEEIADLKYQVEKVVLSIGFGVIVTTASGKEAISSYEALVTVEDLNVSIVHNPTMDQSHKTLDALLAAIGAIHGQSVQAAPPVAQKEWDFFRVTGHQRRLDAPPDCNVHELYVSGGLRLL